ncbi:MAG: hypothetical protein ACYSSO_14590 [Planctomycetota bacterium]|jgi:hypothetical protein
MIPDKKIKELEKAKRKSGGAMPVLGCFFLFATASIWLLSKFIHIPTWLSVIVIGLTAFTFVGDVINYLYCGWKLKALRHVSGQE